MIDRIVEFFIHPNIGTARYPKYQTYQAKARLVKENTKTVLVEVRDRFTAQKKIIKRHKIKHHVQDFKNTNI